ncbi:AAA family ATPase [Sediminicola luteus]|uniref:AAA+ ATPase domain-containing protein n=1 Tax=Sediminicola luteus TaxID=319238 RepID=A0A2A4GEV5_9FLAO|nr:AAA family ATPase [Sediminicola luteus]PCE66510.1 hypothetical protein B7P33_04230 [Sediminicola luteus]
MPYITQIHINTERTHPFPYDVPSIQYAKRLDTDHPILFLVGDNGSGKSTLLEALAFRLQLPHMDGGGYGKRAFQAAVELAPYLELEFGIDRPIGFFFRAEDFGDFMNSIDRTDFKLHQQMDGLDGAVPPHIIQQMKDNANYQIHHMRKEYGQDLNSFSHGEAYLKILQDKINQRGIYLLDEPEAALSPAKQIALIYHINQHLKQYTSQFIIATHSPILMSIPGGFHYEITEGAMVATPLKELEHYSLTKGFLNNPDLYLRHLG